MKSSLRKNHLFTRTFDKSIAKFFLFLPWPNFTVVKYNSKISNIYHYLKFWKSIINRCSIKKLFSKISQYLQENTCVGVSFLIKMQAFRFAILLKTDSNTDVSREYCKTFKNTWEHLWTAVWTFSLWINNITSNIESEEDTQNQNKKKTLDEKKLAFSLCSWSFRFLLFLHCMSGGVCPT